MPDPHIVLATMGTMGDAVPFTALAREMKRRGHAVTLVTSGDHRMLAERHGIAFTAAVEGEDSPQIGRDEVAFFRDQMIPSYYGIERTVRAKLEAGERVFVINRFGNWGALFTCERHRLPFVNILLQPASIWEEGQPISAVDLVLVNRFRQDIGLQPIQVEAVLEPALASVSLYPEWFGHPQTLSDKAGHCFGFPYLDDAAAALPPDILRFIADHGPPVVFTAGTGVQEVGRFIAAARGLHAATGRAVLVISRFAQEEASPAGFRVCRYLDHGLLFPRAAAVVHNGGIGAIAQALRAGVPQAVVPLCWDQPDNAARLEELGVGITVPPADLSPERMVAVCTALDAISAKRLRLAAAAVHAQDGVRTAMDHVERVMRAARWP